MSELAGLLTPEVLVAAASVLGVVAGSIITGIATGLNERRRRKNELEDRRENDRAERDKQKRALLLQILEHRSGYIQNSVHAARDFQREFLLEEHHALLNTAAATGDREVIKTVDYFLDDRFDDEGELLDLVTDRIAAMDAAPERRSWWRRALGR